MSKVKIPNGRDRARSGCGRLLWEGSNWPAESLSHKMMEMKRYKDEINSRTG